MLPLFTSPSFQINKVVENIERNDCSFNNDCHLKY